jgi:predicted transcriptional regulator
VVKYSLAYINPAVCAADNGRVLGYDNSHDHHHRRFMGKQERLKFPGYEVLATRFYDEVRDLWRSDDEERRKPTKKTLARVTVSSGSVEAFIGRSVERARRLDRGEKLTPEITMTFEDPADLVRVLSAERVRVIHALREKPAAVSELAARLRRDRKAVKRDVSLLEFFGLVNAREEINPGHGRRRILEPLAANYQLVATI